MKCDVNTSHFKTKLSLIYYTCPYLSKDRHKGFLGVLGMTESYAAVPYCFNQRYQGPVNQLFVTDYPICLFVYLPQCFSSVLKLLFSPLVQPLSTFSCQIARSTTMLAAISLQTVSCWRSSFLGARGGFQMRASWPSTLWLPTT